MLFRGNMVLSRRVARENAFLLAFEHMFSDKTVEELIVVSRTPNDDDSAENETEIVRYIDEFGEKLLIYAAQNVAQLDELISNNLIKWRVERIPKVCLAVLRLALAEMAIEPNSESIVINEAVEIAKKYGNDEDFQFVNGVLGSIVRNKT